MDACSANEEIQLEGIMYDIAECAGDVTVLFLKVLTVEENPSLMCSFCYPSLIPLRKLYDIAECAQ